MQVAECVQVLGQMQERSAEESVTDQAIIIEQAAICLVSLGGAVCRCV